MGAETDGVLLAQAHEELSRVGQPHTVAALAEIVRQRRNDSEPSGLTDAHVADRAARPVR